MAEEAKERPPQGEGKLKTPPTPLVFISHDSRDSELAEAFSELLRNTTAGMLKSFRSSDKKGTEGIPYGKDWFDWLMETLQLSSDVVCLLTERSLERPWILYEAGVAKGKLNRPVFGVALGIPLSKARTGPFYHFQNCDDEEEALTKLINQLAERIPGCEPASNVVKGQIRDFKERVGDIFTRLGQPGEEEETPSESSTARLFEELKVIVRELPSQVENRLADPRLRLRRHRGHRYHPMLLREFMRPGDPAGILMIASFFRDEAPWLEVAARELYDAAQSRSRSRQQRAARLLRRALELTLHSPLGEEFMGESDEYRMALHHLEMFVEHGLEGMVQNEGDDGVAS